MAANPDKIEAHQARRERLAELLPGIGRFLQLGESDHAQDQSARLKQAWPNCADDAYAAALITEVKTLGLDEAACAAAFVYGALGADVSDIDVAHDDAKTAEVLELVKNVGRMDVISRIRHDGSVRASRQDSESRTESVRRMLIGMVDDVRVVLIRLASRLVLLRNLKNDAGEYRDAVATETLEIFAPLANRLGIWQLKWELEDLAFRYLEPEVYHSIAGQLAERRDDRKNFIDSFISELDDALSSVSVRGEISGRPKHIYSIWRKMNRKNLDFDHVLDIRAVRVLVNEIADCYTALGAVHQRWSHVSGEFDDYIATPKENNYQSIHTAVVGPEGRIVEVQFRTYDMHNENELGVAAHWRYKEGAVATESVDNKVLWLRQLLEWKEEISSATEMIDNLKQAVVDERVYVFTPAGGVIDLPTGATPVDFAYAVHTEVGHRCRGARVGGRIVPLDHALESGDQVEIITGKTSGPSRDWLSATLGYVHTSRARARIQRWFKEQNFDDNVAAGRAALDREIDRLGLRDVGFEPLASERGYRRVEDFLAAIGGGDLRASQAVSSLRNQLAREEEPEVPELKSRPRVRHSPKGMQVQGVGNLMTVMASCCSPVPGDRILGYITRSRGVSIHRHDCHNALELSDREPERVLLVNWGDADDQTFPVDVALKAFDRQGLLRDVSAAFADAGVNVLGIQSHTDSASLEVRMTITIEIADIQNLSRVLSQVVRVPNVMDARRVSH